MHTLICGDLRVRMASAIGCCLILIDISRLKMVSDMWPTSLPTSRIPYESCSINCTHLYDQLSCYCGELCGCALLSRFWLLTIKCFVDIFFGCILLFSKWLAGVLHNQMQCAVLLYSTALYGIWIVQNPSSKHKGLGVGRRACTNETSDLKQRLLAIMQSATDMIMTRPTIKWLNFCSTLQPEQSSTPKWIFIIVNDASKMCQVSVDMWGL